MSDGNLRLEKTSAGNKSVEKSPLVNANARRKYPAVRQSPFQLNIHQLLFLLEVFEENIAVIILQHECEERIE